MYIATRTFQIGQQRYPAGKAVEDVRPSQLENLLRTGYVREEDRKLGFQPPPPADDPGGDADPPADPATDAEPKKDQPKPEPKGKGANKKS